MKLQKLAGATSEIWQIFIQDSSSTVGAGLTGLTNASSGLTAYYHRDTDTTATAISLVTMTVGTFTSSGFKEIDATNMPGWYQFCPPNVAIAAGAKSCGFHLKGATNMAPLPIEVQLTAYNPDDVVRLGLTALPNAAAESAGGLYTRGVGAGQIKQTNNGEIDSNSTHVNNVATTSVTTINANLGTTQPQNFTGTGANALVKGDVIDVAGVVQTGGDLFPAVTNIAVTGAALNKVASSLVLTTGSDVGGVANTNTLDAVFDSWTDAAGAIDGYYQFDISATFGAVAVGVTWDGYLVGVVNTLKVYAYNWAGAVWDQVGTIVGIAGTVVMAQEWDLTSAHTGTGGNAGLVRIRFNNTGLTAATLKTDRILLGYAVVLTPAIMQAAADAAISANADIDALLTTTHFDTIIGTPSDTSVSQDILDLANTSSTISLQTNELFNDLILDNGTASAGGASTITIATALGADNLPVGCLIVIRNGTGENQARTITGYVNATKVVTVDRPWTTNPNNTSIYAIMAANAPALSAGLKITEVALTDTLTTYTGNTPQTGDAFARIGLAGAGLTNIDLPNQTMDIVGNITGNLSGSVGSVTGLTASDVGAIKAKTDNLPTDPADASDIAGAFGTVNSTLATIVGYIDTEVAAIKAKTDNLPADPADASDIAGAFSTVNSALATIAGYVDTEVAAIKAKTDLIPAAPAAVGDIPTVSEIADQVWDEVLADHLTAGTTGAALNASGSSGDPWTTALPGAYAPGSAGFIIASIPTAAENADKLLGRNIAGGSDGGRIVAEAFYFLRNKWSVAAGTLTVYGTDDTTPAWTGAVSSDGAAIPIVGNDPA